MLSLRSLLSVLFVAALGCGGSQAAPAEEPEFVDILAPLPGGGTIEPSDEPPRPIQGVDTTTLTPRERETWWAAVSQLYAPCADQAVSIAQCVEESRPCPACVPAANLLADRVRAGLAASELAAAYAVRFGTDIRRVEAHDSPSQGPVDAPVTIVVWHDFQCPACAAAMPLLDEVYAQNSKHLRLVHKFYPLKQHPHADGAARAAIAAQKQGRYWEMEKVLFQNQQKLTTSDLEKYATDLGLDMARFKADMQSEETTATIAGDKADAEKAGLRGTPFIVINGREFNTAFYDLTRDLDPWVKLEVQLKGAPPPAATPVAAPE